MELDAPGDVVITDLSDAMSFGAELVEPAVRDRSANARAESPVATNARGDELVLVIHGMNSHCRNPNVRALAVGLAKRGARALTFDLPGYGSCDGSFWDVRGQWGGAAKSLARIRRVLSHPAVRGEAFAIVGSSMGGALAIFAANELMDAGEHDITRIVLVNPLMRMKTRFPTAVLLGLFILSRVPVLDKLEVSARPSDRKDGDKDMDFDEAGQAQCDADDTTWRGGVSLLSGVELYRLTRVNGDGDATEVSVDRCALARLMRRVQTTLLTGAMDDVIPPASSIGRFDAAIGAGGCAEGCARYGFDRAGHSLTLQSRREVFFDLAAGSKPPEEE